jgi:hypothetical protein
MRGTAFYTITRPPLRRRDVRCGSRMGPMERCPAAFEANPTVRLMLAAVWAQYHHFPRLSTYAGGPNDCGLLELQTR